VKDFEAQYPRALEAVKTDIGLGRLLGVRQTPTYYINGVKVEGGLPPQLLEAAIRRELSKAGAGK
jgi:protein-disulfide isomerase